MICLASKFLRGFGKEPIRLREPSDTLIITGCMSERIDVLTGPGDGITRLVIYTRHAASGFLRRR